MKSFPSAPALVAALLCVYAAHPRFASAAPAQPAAPTIIVKPLADGITFTQELDTNPALIIDILAIDPSKDGVRVETAIANDSLTAGSSPRGAETVESAASRHEAIAAINGDYFSPGDPLGLGIVHGEIYSEPWKVSRAALGISADGRGILMDVLAYAGRVTVADDAYAPITAIDRPLARGDSADLVAYSPLYGTVSGGRAGGTEVVIGATDHPLAPNIAVTGTVVSVTQNVAAPSPIPSDGLVLSAPATGPASDYLFEHMKVGDKVTIAVAIAPKSALSDAVRMASMQRDEHGSLPSRAGASWNRTVSAWSTVMSGIGGGPRLLTGGKVTIDGVDEGFDAAFTGSPNPRTAVGVTKNGHLLLVTVSGRGALSRGVSLDTLAGILQRLGAVDAINLDGGGSSAMDAGGVLVDLPVWPGQGRPVADMLLVYAKPAKPPAWKSASVDVPTSPQMVGTAIALTVTVDGKTLGGSDKRIIWRGPVDDGVGFVSQDGIFHAVSPGFGTVTAMVDGARTTAKITVTGPIVASVPSKIDAQFSSATDKSGASLLAVRIYTASGASVSGITVSIDAVGAAADHLSAVTDEDGVARFKITWVEGSGHIVVSAPPLPEITLKRPTTVPAAPATDITPKEEKPSGK